MLFLRDKLRGKHILCLAKATGPSWVPCHDVAGGTLYHATSPRWRRDSLKGHGISEFWDFMPPEYRDSRYFMGFACLVVAAQENVKASRSSHQIKILLLVLHHGANVFSVIDTWHIWRPSKEESATRKDHLKTNFFHKAFAMKCQFSHIPLHS